MKIALLTPPRYKDIQAIRINRCEILDKNTVAIPLDLAYFSAILKHKKICKTKIIDANGENISFEKILQRLEKFDPDLIIIKGMIDTLSHDLKIAKYYKEINPNTKTVLSSFTCLGLEEEIIKKYKCLDAFARGELDAFAFDLVNKKLEKIDGIVTRGKIHTNIRIVPNLNSLPFPDWDSLPKIEYVAAPGIKPWSMIIASRGCPYHCSFCTIGGNRECAFPYRKRNPKNVVDELELLLIKKKIKSFLFFDETFNIPTHCDLICKEIIDREIYLPWFCEGRVDLVNKKSLSLMKKAGCIEIVYGIETGNTSLLQKVNKNQTIHHIKRAFRLTKKSGIKASAYVMLGLPGETWNTFWRTIKLVFELNPEFVSFSIAIPYPATEFFKYCEEKGLITSYNWEDYNQVHRRAVIKTEKLSSQEIRMMQKVAYRVWFLYKNLRRLPCVLFRPTEWKKISEEFRNYFLEIENIR